MFRITVLLKDNRLYKNNLYRKASVRVFSIGNVQNNSAAYR